MKASKTRSTKLQASRTGWTAAEQHLAHVDPVMARIIQHVGPCGILPRKDYFNRLCQAIINQQISTHAGRTIHGRLIAHFPRKLPTAAGLLKLTDEQLRAVGLSRAKMVYMRDLAAAFSDGRIPVRELRSMEDEQIIETLTQIKGVGRWTAEMFLIFVLNRPDVLPVDDLGLQNSAKGHYRLRDLPKKKFTALGEKWRPHRTVASWYLWRGLTMLPKKKAR